MITARLVLSIAGQAAEILGYVALILGLCWACFAPFGGGNSR
jgi:hypothetical protein